MFKVLKYSFFDLIRSRWSYLYLAFFLILSASLLALSGDVSKVIISLMNVMLILCPLIAVMFGIMYFYNSREFTELLLAQPLPRLSIFWGQYLGLALSLVISLLLGVGIPFIFYGIFGSPALLDFLLLMIVGAALSFIFSGLAFWIALKNENRIRGFGLGVLLWLFLAVIYDGLFLLLLLFFQEYPLEETALFGTMLNPIDLSRILILLRLDISALMGYTGAVFQKFFGTPLGMILAFAMIALWSLFPLLGIRRAALRKDF